VVPRPAKSTTATISSSQLLFQFTKAPNPFSFYVAHKDTGERLFTTEDHPLIFTPQHWRLTTVLNPQSNIYGLGEHAETLRLPIPTNGTFTRTLWSRDSFAIPRDTNLYGVHPVYFDHRPVGDVACVNSRSCKTHTHGVFLLNSNGMDVHFTGKDGKQTLQYDVIGGIIDLYIFASTDGSPVGAAREYAKIVGTPAGIPYWSLGFHQCRYGYNGKRWIIPDAVDHLTSFIDFVEVAEVVANYSKAGIPLETMWTDIGMC
jgi:alpha-glucosidase